MERLGFRRYGNYNLKIYIVIYLVLDYIGYLIILFDVLNFFWVWKIFYDDIFGY